MSIALADATHRRSPSDIPTYTKVLAYRCSSMRSANSPGERQIRAPGGT